MQPPNTSKDKRNKNTDVIGRVEWRINQVLNECRKINCVYI